MPERDAIHLAAPGTRCAGRLATRLQRGTATLGARWRAAGLDQAAAVLACVKPAPRRLRRWPAARLDPGCARRPRWRWPGRRNSARPNRETPSRWAWRQPRTLFLTGGNLGLRSQAFFGLKAQAEKLQRIEDRLERMASLAEQHQSANGVAQ